MFLRHGTVAFILCVLILGVQQPSHAQGLEEMFRDSISDLLGKRDNSADKAKDRDRERDRDRRGRVPGSREEIQLSFAPVVDRVADSVVNVYGTQQTREFQSPFAGDPFFERFFGTPQRRRGRSSLGSGVIVSEDGTILTNNHVIEKMDTVKIALADGREFDCEIVLKDKKSDLAVLRTKEKADFQPIEIGDSEDVKVGDLVLAIGNPFGVGQTVTSGIVSAVSRSLAGVNDYGFFIQTDAAINPGNSGGALVDMNGRLIGVNTMIFSKSGGSVGIGYAVPSNMTRVVLNSAKVGSSVRRPWIGASFQNVNSDIAESLDMRRPFGAMVVEVVEGSPAEKSGLRPGDVLLSVNGRLINHPDALGYRLDTIGVGNDAEFEVLSRKKRKTIRMTLLSPPETVPRDMREMPRDSEMAGATVANLSPKLAQETGISSAVEGVVVVEVVPRSPAAFNGLRVGDIIREVNGKDIETSRQLDRIMGVNARGWQFVLDRGSETFVIERDGPFLRRYRRG